SALLWKALRRVRLRGRQAATLRGRVSRMEECFIKRGETTVQKMQKLYYGVAYYDEYMPYDRLDQDIQMMKDAGINVVRIGESTWSTHEPQSGVFDFTSLDRVLEAMHAAGIQVIVGTPTYA